MRSLAIPLAGLALASLVGCAGDPAYDDSWGDESLDDGKADSVADLAVPLAFDAPKTGEVDEEQIDLYSIELSRGDRVTLVMEVTGGDLSPHLTLFFGLSTSLRSADFEVEGGTLTKRYELEQTGLHLVAVRAFQHQGAGSYRLTARCDGGPCAGELIVEPLEAPDADDCIGRAAVCAFERMGSFGGAVGPVRARSLVEGCLNELSAGEGVACAGACAAGEDAQTLCDTVIEAVTFYADQGATCLEELSSCLDECTDMGESEQLPQLTCWATGFNGTCDGFARSLSACGGELDGESAEACHEHCEATFGAWNDDLDTICTEQCE